MENNLYVPNKIIDTRLRTTVSEEIELLQGFKNNCYVILLIERLMSIMYSLVLHTICWMKMIIFKDLILMMKEICLIFE